MAAVQHDKALGLPGCQIKVALADGLEELDGLLLHPVELAIAALADALETDLGGEVDEEGEVGPRRADGEAVDGSNLVGIDRAGDALVNGGGIEEAVTEDDLPCGERGGNALADVLGAAGGKEEELGLGGHALARFVVLEELADGLAEGRAARLTGQHDAVAGGLKTLSEGGDLGRLSAAFAAFEGDEQTGALDA